MYQHKYLSFPYYAGDFTAIELKHCAQCGADLLPEVPLMEVTRWRWELSFKEKQEYFFPVNRYCQKHLEEFWEFVPEKKTVRSHTFPHWILRKGVEMDETGFCRWRPDWRLHPSIREHRKVFWDQNRKFSVLPSHERESMRAAFDEIARRQR